MRAVLMTDAEEKDVGSLLGIFTVFYHGKDAAQ